ncbi:tRNA pseudouridine(13) synthase TruD [Patescibacteria group bacterium]|nr:tRNA pseudouridine(13) synthase TruD [Patescibacteria group bacterium]
MISDESQKIQQEAFARHEEEHPELLERVKEPNEKTILPGIGIGALSEGRMKGYIRLYPHDYIVEEVTPKEEVITIDRALSSKTPLPKEGENTIYCDLVKYGKGHFDALRDVAKSLGTDTKKIGHADMKEKNAITAQKIALRHIPLETIEKSTIPGVSIRNCVQGKGTIQQGELKGNRFTIFVRTEGEVDEDWLYERLAELQLDGYLNYFSLERFGGLRLINHKLGVYILRGEFEKAVKEALCYSSDYDTELVRMKREEARDEYPDFEKIEEIFSEFPVLFHMELELIAELKKHPDDYKKALLGVPHHVTKWGRAYSNYLFNAYLSGQKKQGNAIPDCIPLLFSEKREDVVLYKPWLHQHKVEHFQKNLKALPYVFRFKRTMQKTKIYPEVFGAVVVPGGVILSFELPKGASATTFLMNLFELYEGEPVPSWVHTEKYDIKDSIGTGSVKEGIATIPKIEDKNTA